MSSKLKVAVLGVGSLGKEHARIYADLAVSGEIDFAGIYDVSAAQAQRVAEKTRARVFNSFGEAISASDAVSIVTPTNTHYEIAKLALNAGKHILLEKPMTDNAAEAAELVQLAQRKNLALQVGHVERFNPILKFLEQTAIDPRFIETHRLSPFPGRSTDIGVVLDLMIHDLDVVLSIVRSPIVNIDAVGIPVVSASEDIANARVRFENGCVANFTASRVSLERMRKIRVFSGGTSVSYISLDYKAQEGYIVRMARNDEQESSLFQKILHAKDSAIVSEAGGLRFVREPVPIEKDEPLKLELKDFIRCVRERQTPRVSGAAAKQALDVAFEITRQIQDAKLAIKS